MDSRVTVVYQGHRYDLDPNYDVDWVAGAIVEAMNRANLARANSNARPTNLDDLHGSEADGSKFYPWLILHLADGGDLWVTINEAMHIGLETSERKLYTVDGETEFPDPLGKSSVGVRFG